MNIRESMRLAVSSLNTNKLRSLLTLLGIIIGIMAVVVIMTLSRSLERQVMGGLEGVGTTKHMVTIHERPDEQTDQSDPFAAFSYAPATSERDGMTLEELDHLKARFGDRVTGVDIETAGNGEVVYGDTLEGDLVRRDFKVNAMAIELLADASFTFHDPLHGLQDVADRVLDTPDKPEISFHDDPLRMLRAARFASQLEFRAVSYTHLTLPTSDLV